MATYKVKFIVEAEVKVDEVDDQWEAEIVAKEALEYYTVTCEDWKLKEIVKISDEDLI